ncbi:MAG: EamA family transporter, partial [Dehalococcoidia bacterium]
MSIAILLALGAMVIGGLADLFFKVAQNRGINPATFVFYQATTFTITIYTISIASGQISEIITPTWVFGLPIGLLSYAGVLMFVMSLKDGNASVNAPIFRLSFVITSIG